MSLIDRSRTAPNDRPGLPAHRNQIRTKDRVRDLAEVYTHEREVNAMLDLIPDMFPPGVTGTDLKFLEPACGSGNFLVEILTRKLTGIRFANIRAVERYEHWLLRALASVYGVDICTDNVLEARQRMAAVVREHYLLDANTIEPTEGFVSGVSAILDSNIICADTLASASTTEVIDYIPGRNGTFMRVWSMLDNSDVDAEPDLFNQSPMPKRDEVAIHYSEIATTPGPAWLELAETRARRTA